MRWSCYVFFPARILKYARLYIFTYYLYIMTYSAKWKHDNTAETEILAMGFIIITADPLEI